MPQGVNSYGITVDHNGRVWVSSTLGSGAARFDPVTETWDVVMGFFGGSGLAEGPDNLMYVSAGSTIRAVDIDSLALGMVWTTQESVKGVSFDADGYLWGVTYRDEKDPMSFAAAYKIDVSTMTTDGVYAELGDPYTYSDMTGNALGSVACAPEG
jgi:streptogramin lyase